MRCSLQCRELVTYRPLAHLATLRVYQNFYGNRKHRIILFLPPNVDPRKCVRTDSLTRLCTHLRYSPSQTPPAQNPRHPQFDFVTHHKVDADTEPDFYDLDITNDNVMNQFVVAERPKDASFGLSGCMGLFATRFDCRAERTYSITTFATELARTNNDSCTSVLGPRSGSR